MAQLFFYDSGCSPDSWCGFSRLRLSISGSKAPDAWSKTNLCWRWWLNKRLQPSSGQWGVYAFWFSPRQRMVGLVVLHFFDKFGVEVVLVKGAFWLVGWVVEWLQEVFLISPSCSHFQHLAPNSPKKSIALRACGMAENLRLWKIADIPDGDLNVALGPAKAKSFISDVTPVWTEEDGIGVGCNTCKDGCLSAMSFKRNLYCYTLQDDTHTIESYSSFFLCQVFLFSSLYWDSMNLHYIYTFAPVSSFGYCLSPRWFTFIRLPWRWWARCISMIGPSRRVTRNPRMKQPLNGAWDSIRPMGSRLGSKNTLRWCIQYTYII